MLLLGKIGKITRLQFTGIFTKEYCEKFINFLNNVYEPYLLNKPVGKHELRIMIDSPGGSCEAGYNMINLFLSISEKYDVKIKTYARAMAYSMGSSFFMIGHERFVEQYSCIGFHSVFGGAMGKIQDMESSLEHMRHQMKAAERCYTLRMGEEWAKKTIAIIYEGREHVFYYKDALKEKVATGLYTQVDF